MQLLPQKQLTVKSLAEAIEAALRDTLIQKRAAELGAKIRGEDGVARTVEG